MDPLTPKQPQDEATPSAPETTVTPVESSTPFASTPEAPVSASETSTAEQPAEPAVSAPEVPYEAAQTSQPAPVESAAATPTEPAISLAALTPETPEAIAPTAPPAEAPVSPLASSEPEVFNPFAASAVAAPIPGTTIGSNGTSTIGATSATSPSRFGGKKKLFAIIGAIGAVILLGSGAAAYTVINNSPDKILRDAFFNTVKQQTGNFDGSLTSGSGDSSMKLTAKGSWTKELFSTNAAVDIPKTDFSAATHLTADVVSAKDKVYIKAGGVKTALDSLAGGEATPYDSLVAKIDGKWVQITESDLEQYLGVKADDSKQTECVQAALNTFSTNKKQQSEVFGVYKQNQFVTYTKLKDEAVDSRSAYHFTIKFDEAKAKTFAKSLEGTAVYKTVHDCVKDATNSSASDAVDSTSSSSAKQPDVDLWIDKGSRTLRKIQLKSPAGETTTYTAQMTFDYKTKPSITEPKADTTFKDLKTEIDNLTAASASSNSSFDDTEFDTSSLSTSLMQKATTTLDLPVRTSTPAAASTTTSPVANPSHLWDALKTVKLKR